ncbi:hypothetical protein [Rhodopirellula sp. P2]|uniref:hypothetical protein n=1 Tax=Rhodopirellula sp. P2 TaxID=2127060 RepID=UPI002368D577|nr:hypothetical protein [Rhodopirellula sp. P2]WDQ17205.1 hypothetical protein PSR62_01310 [Rhodopirellula sp. P2]
MGTDSPSVGDSPACRCVIGGAAQDSSGDRTKPSVAQMGTDAVVPEILLQTEVEFD